MNNSAVWKSAAGEMLSEKRFRHCVNVAKSAGELAKIYGADIESAYQAGLLHDICKEMPPKRQYEMVLLAAQRFTVCREELASKQLWHSIAGAFYAEEYLGVNDADILNAMRYHTVGRGGMSRLEEVVYLADLISADRDYKDVGKFRKLAFQDIDTAMAEAFAFSLQSVSQRGNPVPVSTVQAYNYYIFRCRERAARNSDKK